MHRLAVVAMTASISWSPLVAQEPEVVTEAVFLTALGEDHPAVAALREQLGIARSEAIGARTLENPELATLRESPAGATDQLSIMVTWQLPRPSRRRLSVASAERGLAAAEARFAEERLELRLALREVFAEWAVATARAQLLGDRAARIVELAERERHRAERGEVSELAARRLALELTRVGSELALAEAEVDAALAAARGWQPSLSEEAVPALPALPPEPPNPEGPHPRLTALEEELAAALLRKEAAAQTAPWPELLAGWQRQKTDLESFEGPILGFAWAIPVANRNRAEKTLAAARVEATAARLEAAERQIEAERSGAAVAYRRLVAAAVDAEGVTAETESMLTAAVAAFQLGESSLTDLLELLRSTVDAGLTALDLHATALAAHRALERLVGQSLELDRGSTTDTSGDIP